MNFLSICVLLGCDISGTREEFLPRDKAEEALDIHRQLVAHVPKAALDWSSIGMLDAMTESDELAYCPMVFCFNSYARLPPKAGRSRLAFAEIMAVDDERLGAVAGGAGLALSASCRHVDVAIEVMAHLMSRDAQLRMALAGGQPARRDSWLDAAADGANGRLFSSVIGTMEPSALRPRHTGYMALQNRAGDLLRDDAMTPGRSAKSLLDDLQGMFSETK
jgi:multiple sugar transport system substrate-binding protein